MAQRDDVSSVSDLGNSRNKSLEKNLFPTFQRRDTHKRALVDQLACANFYLPPKTDLQPKKSRRYIRNYMMIFI